MTEEDTVFTPANTDLYTDGGRLPRPFMGRGSLRRRDYRLSSNASLQKTDDRSVLVNNEGRMDKNQNCPRNLKGESGVFLTSLLTLLGSSHIDRHVWR